MAKKDEYEFRPYKIGAGQQSFSFKKFWIMENIGTISLEKGAEAHNSWFLTNPNNNAIFF